jgi:hypothetical protein
MICDDGNSCTTDSCSNGVCTFNPIPNCCTSSSQCNDNNACTTNTCTNNRCAYTSITSCTNSDGCCPIGCTSLNDNDCQSAVSCNNNGNCDIYIGETCANCGADCECSTGYTCNSNGQCVASIPSWQTGLVSWWKFNGNPSDSIGTNHGTVNGATLTSTGCKSGQCYSFDGVNDYVLSNYVVKNTTCFSAWVYAKSVKSKDVIWSWGGTYGNSLMFWVDHLDLYASGGGFDIEAFTVSPNTWFHVVACWDEIADNASLWVNGNLIGSDSDIGSQTKGLTYIGGSTVSGQAFNGTIDEVMIFNRSLSSTEISELYNSF